MIRKGRLSPGGPFSWPVGPHRDRSRQYDADAIREEIAKADVEAVIPAKSNRRTPIPHDRAKYKWRNLIERLFNKLKNWRRVATRYDKTRESYLGFVALASIKLWIPFVHET